MTRFFLVVGFAGAMVVGLTATAEAGPQTRQDIAAIQDNKSDMADDKNDKATLDNIVSQWRSGRQSKTWKQMQAADKRLHAWLSREIAESKQEVAEAERELAQSQAEVRRTAAQSQKARAQGNVKKAKEKTAATKDDKADAADDRRDLQEAKNDLARTQAIADDLRRMQGAFDARKAGPDRFKNKNALLTELQSLAQREIAREAREAAEDREELREDTRKKRR